MSIAPLARATPLRIALPWTLGAAQAALLVRGDRRPFALIGRWAGGGALIGAEPIAVAGTDEDPFALLGAQPSLDSELDAFVGGGWFGYLGYELGARIEPVGASPPGPDGLPPFALAFYDHLMRLDADGRWWFEALWTPARAAALDARRAALEARAGAATTLAPRPVATTPWRSTPGRAGHERAVAAGRRRIHAGDLFQANVCRRLDAELRAGDPIDLFVTGQQALRPDRAAFCAGPWGAVASLSPELFLERRGDLVRSAPIKGTARRDERTALLASAKDRAENVMIVDLVRNDLGRVCRPGSIAVETLADARSHVDVWHLVSEVNGRLRDGVGDAELVRAAFPPGSVTGTPKVAALNVIAELESTPRGVYTGAIGFASPAAGLELSVAIRTFELRDGRAWLGVGGGIVADSDPAAEAEECLTKARPLIAAIGATLARDEGAGGPALRRRGPRPIPRPDPSAGVFETVLVRGGHPLDLDAHLVRLARSVRALYGADLPHDLLDRIRDATEDGGDGRLRIVAAPRSGFEVAVSALPERPPVVGLVPVTVPGGIGGHKWLDRGLLDALEDGTGQPLLCDLDGHVLEAARANVFAVEADGGLVTPPADGRILPGVTRARVLALAALLNLEVRIAPLALERLACAAEVFVTGSLGGVEPAQLVGMTVPEPGEGTTARLASELAAGALPLMSIA